MHIEKLTSDDVKGLSDTIANLREVGLEDDRIRQLLKTMADQDIHVFVAREDEIIGSVSLIVEQKLIHEGGIVGHIEDVATRKSHEGKGVGSALMKEAVSYAKKRGCYKVMLDCETDLMPFYERFGFKEGDHSMRLDL